MTYSNIRVEQLYFTDEETKAESAEVGWGFHVQGLRVRDKELRRE